MDNFSFENHITKQFDEELEEIRSQLLEMGGLVEEQLRMAIRSIEDADSGVAETVIRQETLVDGMERSIDEACTLIIARRQPAASDLRLIVSVGRAVSDLERIGDEAKKIAQLAITLTEEGKSPRGYTEVRHIGQCVTQILHSALDAFARFDATAALETLQLDDQIDQDYKTAVRELVTYMMEDPRSISRVINILWVIRALERIGDHSKNLCEQIVFVVQGRDIRHGQL
ncbi:MAG: phosphate transport system protein [Halieaceae bacterium]|jgi:phosphate transport system protein